MDLDNLYAKANAYMNTPEDDDVENGGSAGRLIIARNEFYDEIDKLLDADRIDDGGIMDAMLGLCKYREAHALTHIIKKAPVGAYIARQAADALDKIYDEHTTDFDPMPS